MKHSDQTRKQNQTTWATRVATRNNPETLGGDEFSLSGTLHPSFSCAYGLLSIWTYSFDEKAKAIEKIVTEYGKPFIFTLSHTDTKKAEEIIKQNNLKNFRVLTETESWHGKYPVCLLICEVNQ